MPPSVRLAPAVMRAALLAGVLLSVAIGGSFGAVQWAEQGAVDGEATLGLAGLFLVIWCILLGAMQRLR